MNDTPPSTRHASTPLPPDRLAPLLASRAAVLAFVRARVPDAATAEDIVQDSFLKALRAAPTLRDEDRLLGWFYQIIRNTLADYHRRMGREVMRRDAYARELDLTPEDEARLCRCFAPLLPTLNPAYADVLARVDLGGMPYAEAAQALGITTDALKVRRMRARKQLRAKLEETCRACAAHGCLDCTCGA